MKEQGIKIHDDYCKNIEENKITDILSKITVLLENAAYRTEKASVEQKTTVAEDLFQAAPLPNQMHTNKIELTEEVMKWHNI